MNAYENKFVIYITKLNGQISVIETKRNDIDNEIKVKKKHKKNLLNVIEDSNVELIKQVLGKELTAVSNEIDDLVELSVDMNVTLRNQFEELKLLRQICPHVQTEYHSYDHHKGEEYNRCLLCGTVI